MCSHADTTGGGPAGTCRSRRPPAPWSSLYPQCDERGRQHVSEHQHLLSRQRSGQVSSRAVEVEDRPVLVLALHCEERGVGDSAEILHLAQLVDLGGAVLVSAFGVV